MGITVEADNVQDALYKLGGGGRNPPIGITWRRSGAFSHDFQEVHEHGCIVDATAIAGEEVKRSFKTSGEALRYIAGLLKKHDAWIKAQAKERAKKEREFKKLKPSGR